MGKHSSKDTAQNSDTRAGGNKMGKHEKGFDSTKENAHDMLDRIAKQNPKPMGDLSTMDEGGY